MESRPIAPETWEQLPPEVQAYILVLKTALRQALEKITQIGAERVKPEWPAEVKGSAFGQRLQAWVAILTGRFCQSRWQVDDFCVSRVA